MNQTEDFGARRAFFQSPDDVAIADDVGLKLAGLNVEDEDEDGHAAENVVALVREVVLDEAILSIKRGIVLVDVSSKCCLSRNQRRTRGLGGREVGGAKRTLRNPKD